MHCHHRNKIPNFWSCICSKVNSLLPASSRASLMTSLEMQFCMCTVQNSRARKKQEFDQRSRVYFRVKKFSQSRVKVTWEMQFYNNLISTWLVHFWVSSSRFAFGFAEIAEEGEEVSFLFALPMYDWYTWIWPINGEKIDLLFCFWCESYFQV